MKGGLVITRSNESGSRPGIGKLRRRACDIERDSARGNAVQRNIRRRQRNKFRFALDQRQIDAGDARGQRQPRRTDARAEIGDAIARARRHAGREQHGVVTGAVTMTQLSQTQPSTEKCILGDIRGASAPIQRPEITRCHYFYDA